MRRAILYGALAVAGWADEAPAEKHEFQAEVSRLMDIIINSLYTDKSVFLRELVSNAADAVEKARIMSISDTDFLSANKDLEIKLEFDDGPKRFPSQIPGLVWPSQT